MSEQTSWADRVRAELAELKQRTEKLERYLGSHGGLGPQGSLMDAQLGLMRGLAAVLRARLKLAGEPVQAEPAQQEGSAHA